jgi:hypothetical protein
MPYGGLPSNAAIVLFCMKGVVRYRTAAFEFEHRAGYLRAACWANEILRALFLLAARGEET